MKKEIVLALKNLEDKNGRLTAERVFEEAQRKRSPLHRACDCHLDLREGWKKHCVDKAGELIRTYLTVVVTYRKVRIRSVCYVKDPTIPPNRPGYISLTSEVLEREHSETIVEAELDRIIAAYQRGFGVAAVLDARFPGTSDWFRMRLAEALDMRERLRSSRKGADDEDRPSA